MILVDSSVWIAAAKKSSRESKNLKALLEEESNQLSTCKLIQLEVSQGARTKEQFLTLWEGFESLAMLEIRESDWKMSSLNFFKCKKKGLTLSTIDCLIATLAQQYNHELWSLDKVFKKVAPVLGIELLSK